MFSLYQIAAAHINRDVMRALMTEFSMPDTGIEECCRGLIVGRSTVGRVINHSVSNDHVKCFTEVVWLDPYREYVSYVMLMKDVRSRTGRPVPEIFRLLVAKTIMTHRSARACISIGNIDMLDYLLKKSKFIYISTRFIEVLICENNHAALQCIFNNSYETYMSWYRRNENIVTMCIQIGSIDIIRLLIGHGFMIPENSIVNMIQHQRYDMIAYAVSNPDVFTFDGTVVLYTITAENFDMRALKLFAATIFENVEFFINLLVWNVRFYNIMKMYSDDVLTADIVGRVFTTGLDERVYDKCEMFIRRGFSVPDWVFELKIISCDVEFVEMMVRTGYCFNEGHVNVLINVPRLCMRIVYAIMGNLRLNNVDDINVMDILENNYNHNHYVFSRVMRLGVQLRDEHAHFMISKNMFTYIKTSCKHVPDQQVGTMIPVAVRRKKYAIAMYLAMVKFRRVHLAAVPTQSPTI